MSVVSNNSSSKIATLKPNEPEVIDDFIIGDKVFIVSNPEKIGSVAYNGTTLFSEGIWIGVSLDKPLGKNNGTVGGKIYFKCSDNHGIFVRKNNLKKISSVKGFPKIETQINNSNLPKDMSNDESFAIPTTPVSANYNMMKNGINLGDRVCVAGRTAASSQKVGTLRFIGPTKFSEGSWAGIELDNPVGKNDGSVDGIRYFSCKPLYGLFAQEHKVQKFDPSKHIKTYGMSNFSRQGSCESISSVASNFSSASRTRPRTGQNILSSNNRTPNEKSQSTNFFKSKTTKLTRPKENDSEQGTFQKVLKEKEQHIEQLMREREIEKLSLGNTTSHLDEVQHQLQESISTLTEERILFDKKLNELQNANMLACQERDILNEKLEEERKKVEDLLFQMEEKTIDEKDLENKTEESESQIFELNEKLAHEREQREKLESKLKNLSDNKEIELNFKPIQLEELEEKIRLLKTELAKEKQNSQTATLQQTIEEKSAAYNDLSDRFINLKQKFDQLESSVKLVTEENNQLKTFQDDESLSKLNLINDNQMLSAQNTEQKETIDKLTERIEIIQKNMSDNKLSEENNYQTIITKLEKDLKQRESTYAETENKMKQELNNMKIEIEKIRRKSGSYEESVATLQSIIEASKEEMRNKEFEMEELTMLMQQYQSDNRTISTNHTALIDERDKLFKELSSSHDQLTKLRSQLSEWHSERQQLIDWKTGAERQERNLKSEIEEMKSRIEFMDKENGVLNENLMELQEVNHTADTVKELKQQLNQLDESLKKERDENLILITKNATLYSEVEEAKHNRDEQYVEVFERSKYLEEENQNLLDELENFKLNLKEKNDELIVIRERLLKVTEEHESLQDNYHTLSQKYDREKKLNAEKHRKLEKQLDESERKSQFSQNDSTSDKRKSEGKDVIGMLKAAKENAEQQISFLNTVIGDREKKYQMVLEENQNLLNKIKDIENGNLILSPPGVSNDNGQKLVAPRLYCDECEIFDAHDTDDCPSLKEHIAEDNDNYVVKSPLYSNKNNSALATRLYCDICEVFDEHNTTDCQYEQTF